MNTAKIIFITDSLNAKHGVAKSGYYILRSLQQHTTEIKICSNDISFDIDKLLKKKLSHITTPPKPLFKKNAGWIGPKTMLRWLKSLYIYFLWLLKKHKITGDIILVNGQSVSASLYAQMQKHVQGKKILIVHESPRHYDSSHLISLKSAIEGMEKFDGLIFVSTRCQKEWLNHIKNTNITNYSIPNCADEETANKLSLTSKMSVKKNLNFPSNATSIVCVGSIQPRKGQDILIENIAPILKENKNIHLYLVGADMGGWILSLRRNVRQHKLNAQIQFVPFQKDVMSWIYAADLLVVSSRAEAMPLVILESMILKTPVLASNIDGIPELIQHKKTGWLFELNDQKSFQTALHDSLNSEKQSEIISNAYQFYRDNFSQEKLSLRYKHVIEQLMST